MLQAWQRLQEVVGLREGGTRGGRGTAPSRQPRTAKQAALEFYEFYNTKQIDRIVEELIADDCVYEVRWPGCRAAAKTLHGCAVSLLLFTCTWSLLFNIFAVACMRPSTQHACAQPLAGLGAPGRICWQAGHWSLLCRGDFLEVWMFGGSGCAMCGTGCAVRVRHSSGPRSSLPPCTSGAPGVA